LHNHSTGSGAHTLFSPILRGHPAVTAEIVPRERPTAAGTSACRRWPPRPGVT